MSPNLQVPHKIPKTPVSLPQILLWKPTGPKSRPTDSATIVAQRAEARALHEGYKRDRARQETWPEAYIAVDIPEIEKKVKKRRWWQTNGDMDLWR